ncbi:MAG: peptidylprolyl isomerase [Bryobacterales bacterium]|nr:peptidylprolyl isomerase [Bryobacterales bacterium]
MAQTGTAPAAKKATTTKTGAAPKAAAPKAVAPKAVAPKTAAPKTAAPKVVAPAKPAGLYATIAVSHGATPLGRIVIKFYEKESPVTVKNFTDLALGLKEWTHPETGETSKKPLYNGLTFHRVIPGFMIQGGDPTGTGMGRTEPIPDEFHPELKFDIPGRVAMANAGPGTGSCQFFLTEAPTPHLTGRHTIFGQVVEGQGLVESIARLPRGGNDRPETPVVMTRVTVQRIGPGPAVGRPAVKKAVTSKKAAPATKKTVTPATKKSAAPATTKKTVAPVTK